MKKFTVKRSKWLRGTGRGELLNDEGKMCSLGFALNQICRIPKKELLGVAHPTDVISNRDTTFTKKYKTEGYNNARLFVEDALKVNDNAAISDKTREKLLTKIFKEAGIKVTFV